MKTKHILAALSYFSIFFAGVIVPLVLWIIADDPYVKRHSRRALLSHILPYGLVIIGFMTIFTGEIMASLGLFAVFAIVIFVMVVWNVVMGLKVIKEARR